MRAVQTVALVQFGDHVQEIQPVVKPISKRPQLGTSPASPSPSLHKQQQLHLLNKKTKGEMVCCWLGERGNSREIAGWETWLGSTPVKVQELKQPEALLQGWDRPGSGPAGRETCKVCRRETLVFFLGDSTLPAERREAGGTRPWEDAGEPGPRARQAALFLQLLWRQIPPPTPQTHI